MILSFEIIGHSFLKLNLHELKNKPLAPPSHNLSDQTYDYPPPYTHHFAVMLSASDLQYQILIALTAHYSIKHKIF